MIAHEKPQVPLVEKKKKTSVKLNFLSDIYLTVKLSQALKVLLILYQIDIAFVYLGCYKIERENESINRWLYMLDHNKMSGNNSGNNKDCSDV